MKRTPLKPGRKSLERGSTFASRGNGLKRGRKPLKSTTWKAPASLTKTGVCANCGAEGETHWHHAVPRSLSRIGRDNPLNLLELDPACHNAWHAGTPLSREVFTEQQWAFVSSLMGPGWLGRRYPRTTKRAA